MKIASVKIIDWDEPQLFKIKGDEEFGEIKKGRRVVVRLDYESEDVGTVLSINDIDENISPENSLENKEGNLILRNLKQEEFLKLKDIENEEQECLAYCQECVKNLGLEMKLAGVHLSFDNQKIIFAFTAEGRIDFRELVKMLTRRFKKAIRMHQIGIRDEAKLVGSLGMCGRTLCCKKFLKTLASVNSEAAEIQQIAHRGADRISGICGRLMCCLNYEKDGYKKLADSMPAIDSYVRFEGKKCKVLGWHVLKKTVDIALDENTTLEVEIGKLKTV